MYLLKYIFPAVAQDLWNMSDILFTCHFAAGFALEIFVPGKNFVLSNWEEIQRLYIFILDLDKYSNPDAFQV